MAIVFKKNYSASTAYSIDNIVRYTDGKTYISLANSNTGHTPGASGSESYWKELAGVKYNSDNPDWEENDTTKSSYIKNRPFIYNGTIVYNDNASAFENFCLHHELVNGYTIIIDGVTYTGEIEHVGDEYSHFINIRDEDNNKYYCLYWSGRDLHFKDTTYADNDSATFDKIIPGDTNIIVADNRTAQPLFGFDENCNIGYLTNYYSDTGTTNEQVSGDITLKLGNTEYTGDNIVYNYDTDTGIYYITLTKNNLDVISIRYYDWADECDISYYDDTGAIDHTDTAQDPSSYQLNMYLNKEIYDINPLYNTFFDSLGGSGAGIDVDYETTDTQVVVTMTSGSNTATISFDLADIKEY